MADQELEAIRAVWEAIEDLDTSTQQRVLTYIGERTHADLQFDSTRFMEGMSKALNAVNDAAAQISKRDGKLVSGAQVIQAITRICDEAQNTDGSEGE